MKTSGRQVEVGHHQEGEKEDQGDKDPQLRVPEVAQGPAQKSPVVEREVAPGQEHEDDDDVLDVSAIDPDGAVAGGEAAGGQSAEGVAGRIKEIHAA